MVSMEAARITPRKYGGRSAEERKAERRTSLLTVALDIWQEQGWAAVTMRGVCARAGLTDRYFYESFADRDELLATVWDQVRAETLTVMLGVVRDHSGDAPLEQLRAVIDVLVHHIADEPSRAQIMFGDHAGSAILEQRRRDTIQLATDLMIQQGTPYLRPDASPAALRMSTVLGIGGFVEAVLAWRAGLMGDIDADEVIEHLASVGVSLGTPFLAP